MAKINYKKMYTLRSDGRYQGYWRDEFGKRHTACDRDPEKLFFKIQEKEAPKVFDFNKISELWEEEHMERISYKAAEAYRAPLRRVREKFGTRQMETITAAEISAFLVLLGKQQYCRRTVQMHRDLLNMIFNFAIVNSWAKENPCRAVPLPKGLTTNARELPDDKAIAAVRSGGDAPFGLFALICLYAGLRRGEALALRYEDIDWENKCITVDRAVEFVGNNPHLKDTKTVNGRRSVDLLDVLAEAIPKNGSGYLFAREDGGLLTKTQYRKRWEKYCQAIGYQITAHQLRHGYATILFEAGIPDKDAQELLGHSDITLTKNIYTHIRQTHRAERAAKLNAYLNGNLTVETGKA